MIPEADFLRMMRRHGFRPIPWWRRLVAALFLAGSVRL